MTEQTLSAGGIVFSAFAPLIDGAVPACVGPQVAENPDRWTLTWSVGSTQRFVDAQQLPGGEGALEHLFVTSGHLRLLSSPGG